MKIICAKNNLRDSFQLAERFTGKNLTLPVLGNIFIEADDRVIRFVATNLEVGAEVVVPGKVVKSGSVSIPGRVVSSLIQSLDDETAVIEEKSGVVLLSTDSSNFTIQGVKPDDFPKLPKVSKDYEFSVSSSLFKNAIQQVIPSVSVSDFKPEISGVYFKTDTKNLTLAATDSFRLAEKFIKLSSGKGTGSCIVPARVCQELARALPEDDDEVAIGVGEHQIIFDFSGVHMVSRLIDGAYPDYLSIIPKDFTSHIVAEKEEFVRKIKAASVLSSKLNDIAVVFSSKETFVETASPDLGKSKIQLSSKAKGKDGRVSFNFRYLSDGLEAVRGQEAVISLNGDSSPALIQDSKDPSFRYVVMPIRNV